MSYSRKPFRCCFRPISEMQFSNRSLLYAELFNNALDDSDLDLESSEESPEYSSTSDEEISDHFDYVDFKPDGATLEELRRTNERIEQLYAEIQQKKVSEIYPLITKSCTTINHNTKTQIVSRIRHGDLSVSAARFNGVFSGVHCWEICWPRFHRNMYSFIGLSTVREKVTSRSGNFILGKSEESWGWNLTSNKVFHSKRFRKYFPHEYYYAPNHIFFILDREKCAAYIVSRGRCIGKVFSNLPTSDIELFFSISSAKSFQFKVRYSGINNSPPSLQYLCGNLISSRLPNPFLDIHKLPLPTEIIKYLSKVNSTDGPDFEIPQIIVSPPSFKEHDVREESTLS